MHGNQRTTILQFINQKQFLSQDKEGALLKELTTKESEQIINGSGEFRNRVYTPLKTLYTFIRQVLSADNTCKKAVSGIVAEYSEEEKKPLSINTGAYVKARKRLCGEVIHELTRSVGLAVSTGIPANWKPYGRDLKVFDGTTIILPDTPANHEVYPKHSNQKSSVGFPMIRLIVVMSLITGCVINYAYGACKGKGTGEISLLRCILDCINNHDIVVADRYFCNFFLFHDLQKKQVDILVPGHTQRRYDFRRGKRLGKKDHITLWKKPKRPDWMSKEAYEQYPDAIQIREFKIRSVVYVTTFLDAKIYPKDDLHELYKRRWGVELHLNSIKTIMKMDRLVCKTPDMIEKEIGVHLLAYNIIRKLMAEACAKHQAVPWNISFKASLQLLNEFIPYITVASSIKKRKRLVSDLLQQIVKNKVGNRPGRVEPRAVRKTTSSFPALKNTRKDEQQRLLKLRKARMDKNEAA